MDKTLYRKILTYVPIFKNLSPQELEAIIRISRLLKVKAGVTVVEEGEKASAMYIMVEGQARVFKRLGTGEITQLAHLKSPTVFGELSLIDESPRSASVVTTKDSIVYQVDLEKFNELRHSYHPAAFKVLREIAPMICTRMRQIGDRIGDFFSNPTHEIGELVGDLSSNAQQYSAVKQETREE